MTNLDASQTDEEASFQQAAAQAFWAVPLPLNKRCALSLLPLREAADDGADAPPTVEWDGRKLHAPLANLWAHCVRDVAPS